jgi:hypothetical protein
MIFVSNPRSLTQFYRFIKNEQWRKEFGTDELVQSFKYTEKPEVSKYYPQYYHKTDKARQPPNLKLLLR